MSRVARANRERVMRIDIVTVFPDMVRDALAHSIVKRAMDAGVVTIQVVNLRDFATDRHKTTDDVPYGGGGGMVMKIEPIARALAHLTGRPAPEPETAEDAAPENRAASIRSTVSMSSTVEAVTPRIILTDPRGKRFDQETARAWARESHLILLCGHYEGVDDRVRQHLATDEASIGDYVLTGGELPALVIVDAVTRLQAGALGDEAAPANDSFAEDLLEYPHYTRPREFSGWQVPEMLLCGHHAEIVRWRRWHQLHATHLRRPDLFAKLELSAQDKRLFEGPEPAVPMDQKTIRLKAAKIREHEDTDGTGI
jgi:tRNA (guanine37-N1)-methyltransferase